jgi:hypothetical protein
MKKSQITLLISAIASGMDFRQVDALPKDFQIVPDTNQMFDPILELRDKPTYDFFHRGRGRLFRDYQHSLPPKENLRSRKIYRH